ncbi:hypothetical protein C8R47DRAFT_1069609 [Mycena vitilis]|nr:hypothetical protein C8R47DRAFT_1069609 [Mycena vitilis]
MIGSSEFRLKSSSKVATSSWKVASSKWYFLAKNNAIVTGQTRRTTAPHLTQYPIQERAPKGIHKQALESSWNPVVRVGKNCQALPGFRLRDLAQSSPSPVVRLAKSPHVTSDAPRSKIHLVGNSPSVMATAKMYLFDTQRFRSTLDIHWRKKC